MVSQSLRRERTADLASCMGVHFLSVRDAGVGTMLFLEEKGKLAPRRFPYLPWRRNPTIFLAGSLARHTKSCWVAYCARFELDWPHIFGAIQRISGQFGRISFQVSGSWELGGGCAECWKG